MAKSHTIIAHKNYCTSIDIDSKISDSSLWNILNEIKPSQRHALAGLDDISNAGLTAFSVLNEIIKKLDISHEKVKNFEQDLEIGKRYLKFGYAQHCKDNSNVSINFSLYNEKDADFQT